MKNYIDELNRELDKAENNVSVMKSQIKILADILSPANLASENRRKGETARRLQSLEEAVVVLQHMHNGKHPLLIIMSLKRQNPLSEAVRDTQRIDVLSGRLPYKN